MCKPVVVSPVGTVSLRHALRSVCRDYIIWVNRSDLPYIWAIQVTVAIISLSETLLLTYLGYRVSCGRGREDCVEKWGK